MRIRKLVDVDPDTGAVTELRYDADDQPDPRGWQPRPDPAPPAAPPAAPTPAPTAAQTDRPRPLERPPHVAHAPRWWEVVFPRAQRRA